MSAKRRRNLYLYLSLACFLGIIAIFIIDGYMGVYDTINIIAGEREQTIESDVWQRVEPFWSTGVTRGEKAFIRYEVDNRRFSKYEADIEVSVWRMQEKVSNVLSQRLDIGAFDKGYVEWQVDTTDILPPDIPPEQGLEFTLKIKRGEIERNVILYINPSSSLAKPMPVPG